MKNIHILPTDKPSRFYSTARTSTKKRGYTFGEHYIPNTRNMFSNHNIYITNDEKIKEGDWFYNTISLNPEPFKACENGDGYVNCSRYSHHRIDCKKIILTTDADLIKDGVQAIDDDFLEWFVKNPSCEEIMLWRFHGINTSIAEINSISGDGSLKWQGKSDLRDYKIIIPKEEKDYTTLLQTVGTKQTPMQDLREDLILTQTSAKESLLEIENQETRNACQEVVRLTLSNIIKRIDEELLDMEKENMINFLKSVFQQDGFDYEKAFEQFKNK